MLPINSKFWRAQIGNDLRIEEAKKDIKYGTPRPFSPARMKPIAGKAYEGRANAKGIAYLYVSLDEETSIAEVRPWVSASVSVATLKSVRSLRIVDCSENIDMSWQKPTEDPKVITAWRDVNYAFSKPIVPMDNVASYAPTQILAELFHQNGFDGIAYRSSVGPGCNIALFDLELAEIINCYLVKIEKIKLDYSHFHH